MSWKEYIVTMLAVVLVLLCLYGDYYRVTEFQKLSGYGFLKSWFILN